MATNFFIDADPLDNYFEPRNGIGAAITTGIVSGTTDVGSTFLRQSYMNSGEAVTSSVGGRYHYGPSSTDLRTIFQAKGYGCRNYLRWYTSTAGTYNTVSLGVTAYRVGFVVQGGGGGGGGGGGSHPGGNGEKAGDGGDGGDSTLYFGATYYRAYGGDGGDGGEQGGSSSIGPSGGGYTNLFSNLRDSQGVSGGKGGDIGYSSAPAGTSNGGNVGLLIGITLGVSEHTLNGSISAVGGVGGSNTNKQAGTGGGASGGTNGGAGGAPKSTGKTSTASSLSYNGSAGGVISPGLATIGGGGGGGGGADGALFVYEGEGGCGGSGAGIYRGYANGTPTKVVVGAGGSAGIGKNTDTRDGADGGAGRPGAVAIYY